MQINENETTATLKYFQRMAESSHGKAADYAKAYARLAGSLLIANSVRDLTTTLQVLAGKEGGP